MTQISSLIPMPRLDLQTYEQIRETARRFAETRVRPRAVALDESEAFPTDIYAEMAELGLFGITVPDGFGGAGLDVLSYALVMEELSRGYASVADQCGLVELIGTLLSVHGTDAQRASYMADILSARKRVAYCITEAEAGTDVSGIKTTAVRDGSRMDAVRLQDLDSQRSSGGSGFRSRTHRSVCRKSRHVDLHRRS